MVEKISPLARPELATARSLGQHLTHRATGAPISGKGKASKIEVWV